MILRETQAKTMMSPSRIVIAVANENDRKQIASMQHVIPVR